MVRDRKGTSAYWPLWWWCFHAPLRVPLKKMECDTCKINYMFWRCEGSASSWCLVNPGLIYSDSEGKEIIYSQPYLKHFSKMKRCLVSEIHGQSTSNKILYIWFLEELMSFFFVRANAITCQKKTKKGVTVRGLLKTGLIHHENWNYSEEWLDFDLFVVLVWAGIKLQRWCMDHKTKSIYSVKEKHFTGLSFGMVSKL